MHAVFVVGQVRHLGRGGCIVHSLTCRGPSDRCQRSSVGLGGEELVLGGGVSTSSNGDSVWLGFDWW